MAKGNILKEAIADAKAVREVALANAKAALEEAFTPKLQNMLSAKLSEDLDEDMYYDEDEQELDLGEIEDDEVDMETMMTDSVEKEDDTVMDEEIDLEEILNELELEEGKKADEEEEEKVEENFDLDALLEEINNLEKQTPTRSSNRTRSEQLKGSARKGMKVTPNTSNRSSRKPTKRPITAGKQAVRRANKPINKRHSLPVDRNGNMKMNESSNGCKDSQKSINHLKRELKETTKAFNSVKSELNEVNLLNSKLLYVNRIFKANNLDDSQKLRVVETLDKADSTKEAKLIYETIKDTFKVASTKKVSKKTETKTIKENFRGMASKAAGISRTKKTAPKRAVISESNDMVNRFQKLANIKINE